MSKSTEKLVRYALGILLLFVAINAFGGGYYGVAGAENVPTEWLKNSPFQSYFIPGLFLFVVVGGTSLFAACVVFKRLSYARSTALVSGIVILVWLITQMAIIGYVSWMQPATAVTALLILLLAWLLPVNKSKRKM
jgi:hypothetical protein